MNNIHIFILFVQIIFKSVNLSLLQRQFKQRRVLTQTADDLQQLLYTQKRVRLAVFQANRQKEDDFLQKWEEGESQSTITAIDVYLTLFKQFKERVTEQYLVLYEHPLNLVVIQHIREPLRKSDGNYSRQGYRNYVNLNDVVSNNMLYFGFDEPTQTQIEEINNHIQDLQNRLQLQQQPYYYLQEQSIIHSNQHISQQDKEKSINQLFTQYEIDRVQSNFFDEQILLPKLALLITDLERIHPFLDFNCRTFAVFLLNKELIRHNMKPSILEDPNDFDFMTQQELIDKIKEGQKNYDNLVKTGKIHNTDQSDEQILEKTQSIEAMTIQTLMCQTNIYDKNISDEGIPNSIIDILRNLERNNKNTDVILFQRKATEILEKIPYFKLLIDVYQGTNFLYQVEKKIRSVFECEFAKDKAQIISQLLERLSDLKQRLKNNINI